MRAAKVMDVIARPPGCAGRAADAASAYTQYQLTPKSTWRTSIVLKLPKPECPDIWIRLPRHKWPKSWFNIEGPVVLLERNLHGHPFARWLWERELEKFYWDWDRKSSELWMLMCVLKARSIPICIRGWHKNCWKKGRSPILCGRHWNGWSWRTNIVSWPRVLGMHPTWMRIERKHCWRIQKNVRITNLRWSNWTVTLVGRNRTRMRSLGLLTWNVMRRNAWQDVANDE